MSGEASEQREKMAEGAWSLFREHSEYKLESHLLGPSCWAVVFTKMGLPSDLFFFFLLYKLLHKCSGSERHVFEQTFRFPKSQGPCKCFSTKERRLVSVLVLYTPHFPSPSSSPDG